MKSIIAYSLIILLFFGQVTQIPDGDQMMKTVRKIPETLRFEHFNNKNGLPQNAVLAIFQDERGFLWTGSHAGLTRYDGYEFVTYDHDNDNPQSLGFNVIGSIVQDQQGFLWVGTWGGGISRFDPLTEKFVTFRHDPLNPNSLSDNFVTSLLMDPDGSIWIGTFKGGLDHFDPQSGNYTHYRFQEYTFSSLASDNVSCLFIDSKGMLWIGSGFNTEGSGLTRFNPKTGVFTRFTHSPHNPDSLSSNTIGAVFEDSGGRMWVATGAYGSDGSGLNLFYPDKGTSVKFVHDPGDDATLGNNTILSINEDDNGILWLGTSGGGLDLFDPNRLLLPVFFHFRHDPYDNQTLSHDTVWPILKDRSGIIWVGTSLGGLNKYDPQKAVFELVHNVPSNPQSLSSNSVSGFAFETDGTTWVATWGGGLNHRLKNGNFVTYRHDPTNQKSLSHDTVNQVLLLKSGNLLISTEGGLDMLDPDRLNFIHYRNNPQDLSSLSDNSVSSVIVDKNGRFWVGTNNGLNLFIPITKSFIRYQHDPANLSSLSDNRIIAALAAQDGTLWFGTWGGGLQRMDSDNPGVFTHYVNIPNDPKSLSDNNVWGIVEDHEGNLWIATQNGLNQLDPRTGIFTQYHKPDGLPSEIISCLTLDEDGNLWGGSDSGLFKLNLTKKKFVVYNAADGLQSNEFNTGACATNPDGSVYVGGVDGYNYFDPASLNRKVIAPPTAVTAFRVFNEPVVVDLSGNSTIQLEYWQNFISFEFSALDYHSPDKNHYLYKLEGVDQDWIDSGTRHYASYTNLSGGDYTFKVKAANFADVWDQQGLSIPLKIIPPWWQTLWFRLGGIALLLGLSIGIYTLRVKAIRKQHHQLEKEVNLRTAELREAKDELSRRAREELSVSENRFKVIFDSAAVGIAVMNLKCVLVDTNPALSKLLGLKQEEIIGNRTVFNPFSEDEKLRQQDLEMLLKGEKSVFTTERLFSRSDTNPFWGAVTVSVVRDHKGQPRYLLAMLVNVDELRRFQESLRESEARFQAIFENTSVGMTLMKPDRKVVSTNQAALKIMGLPRQKMVGVDLESFSHPDDRQIGKREFSELFSSVRPGFMVEKRFIRGDRGVFWARVTYSVVADENHQVQYLIGILEDITEEKLSQEKLINQETLYRRTLEQRVETRTHELQKANTQLKNEMDQRIKAEEALASKAAEEAVTAERNRLARDLHDAVTQTLFSASLVAEVLPELWKSNPQEALHSTEELRQLTRGALAEMRTLLLELRPAVLTQTSFAILLRQLCDALIGRSRLNIELHVEGEKTLPPDVQMALYRIAQESLNNVFKYAKATRVVVSLKQNPKEVILEVHDNGIGFDTTLTKPTSLGIHIMQERADAIKAKFQVSSSVGEGTSILVKWKDQK